MTSYEGYNVKRPQETMAEYQARYDIGKAAMLADPKNVFGTPENNAYREEVYQDMVVRETFSNNWPGCTFSGPDGDAACAAQWAATGTPQGQALSYEAARDPAAFQAGVNAGGRVGAGFKGDRTGISYNSQTGTGVGSDTTIGGGDPLYGDAGGLPGTPGTPGTGGDAEKANIAEMILESFPWMKDLMGIWGVILEGVKNDLPDELILAQVRETDTYKQRFPAMAAREGKFNPITEAEYLQLEDSYRQLLSSYGVLGTIAPNEGALRDLYTGWIGGDVSPVELSTRLDEGYAAMYDAAPEVKEAFREFYGVNIDDSTLLTYFLDQDLGLLEMENVVGAAQVGGAALKYGLNVTRTRAELLRGEGITGEMAKRGYADVAREQPQLVKLAKMHHYNPLSQYDLEEFTFHEDPNVMASRRRIFESALADFAGAGATSVTQLGTLGELVDFDRSV